MTKSKVYARNIAANWVGYAAKLVVLFFLSPFIVHRLGNSAYGVWCLLVSLTGYMGLLDVGIMTSTSRYINLYLARDDRQNISKVVNTSILFYIGASFVLLIVAIVIGPFLGKIFTRIPAPLIDQARWILYLFCANIFFGFISAVLRQLLAANDRFDLQNMVALIVLGVSTTGTVWLLKAGYGLVALAIVQVISGLSGCIILFYLAKEYGPSFQISPLFVKKDTLRELFNFGIFSFIADVGMQLVFYTDSLVIGIFIGTTAITLYNIGLMLAEHSSNLMKQFGRVMSPDLLKYSGGGNLAETRWLIVKSTRFLMLVAVPLFVGLVMLGRDFIFLWMGPGYEESAVVLSFLAISQLGATASLSCWTTLVGLGRVKFLAIIALIEGILNISLSILFVTMFHLGITGVALGTLIPMLGLTRMLVTIYTCWVVQMKLSEFAKATFFRWLTAAVLFALPCWLASNLQPSSSWMQLSIKIVILGIIYLPIGFYVLLTNEEQRVLFGYLKKCTELRPGIER